MMVAKIRAVVMQTKVHCRGLVAETAITLEGTFINTLVYFYLLLDLLTANHPNCCLAANILLQLRERKKTS